MTFSFQTGDVPPGDFNFEDMKDPKALLDQDALEQTRPSNLNLYPRKRELEAQISAANEDLIKSKPLNKYDWHPIRTENMFG